MPLLDTLSRPLRALRISVTDRCNLRCEYCMPEDEYAWLSRSDLLSFDEIELLVGVFQRLGVDKIRLTGGEPLLRRDLPALVTRLVRQPGIQEVALTTNAVLLADHADALARAGLSRLTVSLDTLQPDRFRSLTRQDAHAAVVDGLAVACRRFSGTRIDAVIMRGVNDDELVPLVEHARRIGAEVRFIEYMDVGGATHWHPDLVVPAAEVLVRLAQHYGEIVAVPEPNSTAPAARYRLPDGTLFGIIASTTQPFCRTCDRARLTADGVFYTCLYATDGLALRGPLRRGATPDDLAHLLEARWSARGDRGAEIRRELRDRSVFLPLTVLRADPHLEMHKRGG